MNDIARPDFDAMPMATIREYASHMGIPLARTAKKEDIKQAILQKLAGRAAVLIPAKGERVPPGHAKILINEDPNPLAKQIPVYLNCNGYQCTIPRGKEVIVPMRVVRALQDSKVKRLSQTFVQDQWGREIPRQTTVTVPSYPFQVLESTPGDEPLTNVEKTKLKTNAPKLRYKAQFGRYPTPRMLERAIEKGLVKIHDDDILLDSHKDIIDVDETEE